VLVAPFALVTPPNWERPLWTADDRCYPLGHPPGILQGRRHDHLRAGANRVTTGQDPDPPRVLRWAVRLTRGSAALVDRLCDCLEVGLGLLGRGGRGQGAVEGGGRALGMGSSASWAPTSRPWPWEAMGRLGKPPNRLLAATAAWDRSFANKCFPMYDPVLVQRGE
jgi:hypothetical protein